MKLFLFLGWYAFSLQVKKKKKKNLPGSGAELQSSPVCAGGSEAQGHLWQAARQLMDMQPEIYWWLQGPDVST